MYAVAIVTLTLAGLAGLLFGSDYLDRRLLVRSGQPLPEPPSPAEPPPTPEAGASAALLAGEPAAGIGRLAPAGATPLAPIGGDVPAPAGPVAPVPAEPPAPLPASTTTDRSARPARVPAPLPACRHGRGRRDRAPQVRHDAGPGPLAVTPGRWGTLATVSGPESPRS